jgi:hypothetical protein
MVTGNVVEMKNIFVGELTLYKEFKLENVLA